jgi:hypothetical protein
MIEMRVREQDKIDAGRIEAEVAGILHSGPAAALIKAAVDQDAFARALDEVTGTGDVAISAMK